jgi:hypothetical protein
VSSELSQVNPSPHCCMAKKFFVRVPFSVVSLYCIPCTRLQTLVVLPLFQYRVVTSMLSFYVNIRQSVVEYRGVVYTPSRYNAITSSLIRYYAAKRQPSQNLKCRSLVIPDTRTVPLKPGWKTVGAQNRNQDAVNDNEKRTGGGVEYQWYHSNLCRRYFPGSCPEIRRLFFD